MTRRIAVALLFACLLTPNCLAGEKIRTLVAGNINQITALRIVFAGEPSVEYVAVPCRLAGVITYEAAMKFIRLYFPRTYPQMRSYDLIILTQPEYNLFTPMQDKWMLDSIVDGSGGINDGSVFSIQSSIHSAWASSLAAKAFPNNARAVSQRGGGEASNPHFQVIIERDYPSPVLTPFADLGVERVACNAPSRLIIRREGAGVLAWQVGNFPVYGKIPYLVAWQYEKGRTMTSGDFLCNGWFGLPRSPTSNQYSPEILMNMFYWLTRRELITDVVVYHRIKAMFREFSSRMVILTSLRDFIDGFGANTQSIEAEISELNEMYNAALYHYLDGDFQASEEAVGLALAQFSISERMAMREKDAALLWVYVVEWLSILTTASFCGSFLWAVMVRRKLYRSVSSTRAA